MHQFKPGDKALFHDESGSGWAGSVHGKVYTVVEAQDTRLHGSLALVYLQEGGSAHAARFTPVPDLAVLSGEELLQMAVDKIRSEGHTVEVRVTKQVTTVVNY